MEKVADGEKCAMRNHARNYVHAEPRAVISGAILNRCAIRGRRVTVLIWEITKTRIEVSDPRDPELTPRGQGHLSVSLSRAIPSRAGPAGRSEVSCRARTRPPPPERLGRRRVNAGLMSTTLSRH